MTATTQAIARSLGVWTLLSGVDEAASARAIDWLTESLNAARPQEMSHVQLMAMGADIDRAVTMVRHLDEQALDQFDTSVELVGVQRQMVPVHLQTLGSFPTHLDQWSTLVKLIAGQAAAADHRDTLVTRITPQAPPSQQAPEVEETFASIELDDPADKFMTTVEITVDDEKTRELLMAARLDGINIQGVELEESETPETPDVLLESPSQKADRQEVQASAELESSQEEIQTDQQAHVVSNTVRNFVERLKQQELLKRQQAEKLEAQSKSDGDDAIPTAKPLTVAQLANVAPKQQQMDEDVVVPKQVQTQPKPAPVVNHPKPQPVMQELPTPTPQVEQPKQEQVQAAPVAQNLASHLHLPGCINLVARCPQHPLVELVLDEEGGLHLLAQHQQASKTSVGDALYEVLDARGWVDQHISLLSLTQKQLRFDMQIRPIVHLFTDDARGGAQLVANAAKFVKIHLLTQVTVGNQSTQYSTELN